MHHQRASLTRGMRTAHGISKPHVALSASAAWTRPTTHVKRGHQWMPKTAQAETVVSTSTQDRAPNGKVSKSGILDASTSFQVHEQQDGFVWTRNWWPIAPLDILDTERPTAHTILGQDLVVWWSKEDKAWHAFKDMCPHRLAPLSQGRIVDGSLVCSYHGWSFGPTGACNKIPQIEPSEQGKVCSNKRTCATHYPTLTENNCLYVWLDTSEQGLAESRARGVAKHPCPGQWSMLQVPNDFRSWMEQAMDPSHANFLHAGEAGFVPENAIPMTASAMPFVHPTQGFTYAHGGYEQKNATMIATRDFIPPSNVIGLYRQPTGTFVLATMFVPVKPGVTRTFASFGFLPPNADHTIIRDTKNPQAIPPPAPAPPKPAADSTDTKKAPPAQQAGFNFDFNLTSWIMTWVFRLVLGSKLPHWVTFSNALNDQDCIIMHGQERNLMTTGMDDTNYVMPAVGADVGVAAINRWLRMVKYPTSLFGDAPMLPRMTEEQLLERQSRHAAYCIQCKKGLQLMNKLCWATTLVSAASAVLTIGLVSAALVTQGNLAAAGWPALAACGASTLLASVAGAMWDLREERFVSGLKAWRKKGGLSFVKQ